MKIAKTKKIIVAIAGEGRKSGKTTLAVKLIEQFDNAMAVKMSDEIPRKSKIIETDEKIIAVEGKDTWRMKKAGAKKVALVYDNKQNAEKILKEILKNSENYSPIIIEGGKFFDLNEVYLKLFVKKNDKEKDSEKIDRRKRSRIKNAHFAGSIERFQPHKLAFLIKTLSSEKNDGRVMEEILKFTRDGIISCPDARGVAQKNHVPAVLVGNLCTLAGIRIDDCSLGCFGKTKMKKQDVIDIFSDGIKARQKIWLEKNGKLVMGEGRLKILQAIQETGSISEGARILGMSYTKAWALIRSVEKAAGRKIVERKAGGEGGGWAKVTPYGKALLKYYDKLNTLASNILKELARS